VSADKHIERDSMKRKWVKILLIIGVILAVLVAAAALTVSPIAKWYIEGHSKEWSGRTLRMSNLHINIFTGFMEIDSLRLYEKDDKQVFASIDTFALRLSYLKLFSSTVKLTEFKVIGPSVNIVQNKEAFNFDDLRPKDTSRTKASSFPKTIIVQNIYIQKGKISYTDEDVNNTITMNDLGIAIPELCFEEGNTNAGIHLKIGERATVNSTMAVDMKTNQYSVDVKLENLPVNMFAPYAKQKLNIGKIEGTLGADIHVTGNKEHVMDFKLNGVVNAYSFNVTNAVGEPLISAETASAKINSISIPKSTYVLDYAHASGVVLNFIMKKDANNFTGLLKPKKDEKPDENMEVKIKDLHVDNSQLIFTDETMSPAVTIPMKKIDFQAADFDMNGKNTYKIRTLFPDGGSMRFIWKGNMNDLSDQQIMVNVQNLSLKLLSPYCIKYTAYDITDGNLNFISQNTIKQDNIKSTNLLDCYKFTVGSSHDDVDPVYHVPMKLALYILKDKDDKIEFDVPVEGNIHDPEFSYSKIIFKTIINLMVKIAVSPFRFLAGVLGLSSDKMEEISIEPLQTDFTAEQYKQLTDLVSVSRKKPEMITTLTQYVDWNDAVSEYSLYKAKEEYLLSAQGGETKKKIRSDEIEKLDDDDKNLIVYLDAAIAAKGIKTAGNSVKEKVKALYAPDSLKAGLMQMLEKRNDKLRSFLNDSYGITEKNIVIKTAEMPALNNYTGKAKYKIEMTLPGTEKEVKNLEEVK
jgi:hypothetical protein